MADGEKIVDGVEKLSIARPQPPSKRAVSLRAVVDFCERLDLWDRPTFEVVQEIVKPATAPGAGPERYHELFDPADVGPTHIFCSHCWGSPFGLLVAGAADFVKDLVGETGEFTEGMGAALTFTSRKFAGVAAAEAKKAGRAADGLPGADIRLWIDIFAIKQHSSNDHECLGGVVAKSPLTLMVLDEAAKPLTRVWCLYEMIKTVEAFEKRPEETLQVSDHTGAEWGGARGAAAKAGRVGPTIALKPNHVFHARMGTHSRGLFRWASLPLMKRAVSAVDMAKAQATVASDKTMILALAKAVKTKAYGDGLPAINKMGKRALCNLIASVEADVVYPPANPVHKAK